MGVLVPLGDFFELELPGDLGLFRLVLAVLGVVEVLDVGLLGADLDC